MLERLGLRREGLGSGAVSGFAAGLISIPEGMAYAKLAGVNPVYGLYSGMVATVVASLSTGTVLMISSLTSAIALTTASVIDIAGLSDADMPRAIFTITLLAGAIMFILGLFRLGNLVSLISNSVMTGFVAGASLLIIISEMGDFSGYQPTGSNKFAQAIDWFANIGRWDPATTAIALITVTLTLVLKRLRRTKRLAPVLTLVAMSVAVWALGLESVELIRSVGTIPNSLPLPMLPRLDLVPELVVGSASIALVALIQGASIGVAYPNPDGSRSIPSRDFVGEGLGNMVGSFFQSMPTGGSLSRTGVAVGSGSHSRWGGVFAGLWLAALVLLFGSIAELVPLPVIAGLLFVIGVELILARLPDARLSFRSSPGPAAGLLITFGAALFVPLQWTIFIGAGLSLLAYTYASYRQTRVYRLTPNEQGLWVESQLPDELPSHEIVVVGFEGSRFYAEVPRLRRLMPKTGGARGSVVVWRMRGLADATSTFLKMIDNYLVELDGGGNILVLEGVEQDLMSTLERTGVIDRIKPNRVFGVTPVHTAALNHAWEESEEWLEKQARANEATGD